MNFLDRSSLPKFQERLDLAASELNDMEEILCAAINEIAGRHFILTNMIPLEERDRYAEDTNCAILDTFEGILQRLSTLEQDVIEIRQLRDNDIAMYDDKYLELEKRLNALDDAAARKDDLNVVLYRTKDLPSSLEE